MEKKRSWLCNYFVVPGGGRCDGERGVLRREKENRAFRNVPDKREKKKGRLGTACGGPLQGRCQKVY